jgi:hypothetical protein
MALRDLSTPIMIGISAAWLDPKQARKEIEALPSAAGLLPKVEEAHQRLLETQPSENLGKAPPELTAVRAEQAEVDAVHDNKTRGIYNALTGFADLADNEELAASYLALRDKLVPPEQGLRVVQVSYRQEAGEAALVEQRLTDADRSLLKKLPMPGGKLIDAHEARVEAATRLGALEDQRAAIEAKEADKSTIKQGDALRARNGWIKAVRALLGAIDLDEPTDTARKRVLGPLDEAERAVARRASSKAGKAQDPAAAETDTQTPA